ncbi:MAG TPA: hypothetical protein VGJ18_21945 [Gemmatimonadaceae bacterium]
MKETPQGLENVSALILERQRIEAWLATLEARKASTPDHVYQRVRGDYSTRLKTITEQLIARSTALKAHVDQLSKRLAQFEAEAQRFKDVRAESELRMQVGELSVPEWNAKARECDDGIARLTEAQAQARGALAQAREILAMVTGQSNGAAPTPSSTSSPRLPSVTSTSSPRVPAVPSTSSPRVSRPVGIEGLLTNDNSGSAAMPPNDGTNMNELEFLNSVVGGGHAPPNNNGGKPPAPNTIELETEGAPDLAQTLLNRVNERAKSNLREDGDADSLLKGVGTPKPGNKDNPLAANVTESNPIVLKPQGGPERHKTLKCQECGTMNYPTEWYCERCGAELVSM